MPLTCKLCGKTMSRMRRNPETNRFETLEDPFAVHAIEEHWDDPEMVRIQDWAHESTPDLDAWAMEEGFVPNSAVPDTSVPDWIR